MPFKIRIRLKIKIQALEGGYTLCLCTNLLRKDLIEGKKTRKNIEIIPQMDGVWDFIDVSVFLNNVLSDWVKEKRTPRIFKSDPSAKSFELKKLDSENLSKNYQKLDLISVKEESKS